jgi:hypothetical protein
MPLTEPVTLEEVRAHMNKDQSEDWDNTYLQLLITACRTQMERQLGIYLVQRLVVEHYRRPCCGMVYQEPFHLKYGPVVGTPVLKDLQGNVVEFTPIGDEWPKYYFPYAVDITYIAGYDELPGDLKLALLMNIATAYENRENTTNEQVNLVSNTARKLAASYNRNVF